MDENKKSIKYWADQDKPREKLVQKGPFALSDSELIAILIGSGTREHSALDISRDLLRRIGHNLNELAGLSHQELKKIKGIGPAKAIAIHAALELGRRRQGAAPEYRKKIQSSSEAASLFSHLKDSRQEEFWMACLNRQLQVLYLGQIHLGGISSVSADPRIIFGKALEHQAVSLIVSHNHPSGNLRPSKEDEAITKKLKAAGELLDIRLADHLIISREGFFSFADEGMI
ncbi:MAG TPA: DNA repair protein RadC [Saprospiraceae bacterium]|nr:DNA repair protein RadC [Saprospiraceae bacterium]HNT20260.1 DNA repair protein RadC [Saprospiraceae bacterium]